jgi:hypothetical protein
MTHPGTARFARWILAGVGLVLHLLVGVLYFGSGLVMPYPWVYIMWLVWFLAFVVVLWAVTRRTLWIPLVPGLALVFWVVVVQLGAWLFGWSA